jgi:hypothetical protein
MRRGSVVKRRVLPLCPQHMTLDTRIAALVQCATTSRNTHAACTASRSSVAQVSEKDLSDQFYAYGEIKTIQVVPASNCAFVTYTTREAAEKAADKLHKSLVVRGMKLRLMWGRAQKTRGSA